MKKKLLVLIMLIALCVPSITYAASKIQACIVDYNIEYRANLTDKMKYPIISYNDNTYISIRDVAALWSKDVEWQEKNHTILLKKKSEEDYIIKEEATALAIGKALINEYFNDRVLQTTVYDIIYSEVSAIDVDDVWLVSAKFNAEGIQYDEPEDIRLNPDVTVEINPVTGDFRIIEFYEKGYETIVDFRYY